MGALTRTVERAINQAHLENLYDHAQVEDVISRANGHPGLGLLNAAVELYRDQGPTPTRSEKVLGAGATSSGRNTAWSSRPTDTRRTTRAGPSAA